MGGWGCVDAPPAAAGRGVGVEGVEGFTIGAGLCLDFFCGDAATQALHTLVQSHFHLMERGGGGRGGGETGGEGGRGGEERGWRERGG